MKKYLLVVFLLISLFFVKQKITYSQNITITAKLDSNKILIGDHVKLKLEATCPAGTQILWPAIPDSVSKNIEIVSKSKIDTNITKRKGWNILSQTFTITSFDSGSFYFPSIIFSYKKNSDTTNYSILSDSVLLNVNTLQVDTTKAIKDIKPPLSAPLTLQELIPYIVGLIVLAGIILFLIYYFRKKKKGVPLFEIKKTVTPCHIEALNALEALKQRKLWQNNKVKDFYTILTEILRTYIEKRFSINALEMISDEIVESLKDFNISSEALSNLRAILTIADLVKFAKAQPLANEHEKLFEDCRNFILETAENINKSKDESQINASNGIIE